MFKLNPIFKTLLFFALLCLLGILLHISTSTNEDVNQNMVPVKFSRRKRHVTQKPSSTTTRNLVLMIPTDKPKKKIFFLKTHKTASSTVYSILARHILNKDLIPLLLGLNGKSYFHMWPVRFDKGYYYIANQMKNLSQLFDVYMEHTRYSRANCESAFPKETTYYFTIIRDPITGWRSSFEYFKIAHIFGLGSDPTPIKTFFHKKFDQRLKTWTPNIALLELIENGLLFDLGYNKAELDRSKLDNIIQQIMTDFNFVMIMEYFDESLIVMRNHLNLTNDDIVTFNINESYGTKRETLSKDIKNKINALNYADRYIYDFFRRKFEDSYLKNPQIVEDTKTLRAYRKHIFNTCVQRRIEKIAYGSTYYNGYDLKDDIQNITTKELCQRLIASEMEIKEILVKHTIEKLKDSN